MAVPKKRMSRTRKLLRRTQWNLLLRSQALKALSLGYSKQLTNSTKEKTE